VQVGLHHHREQRLIDPPAPLQQGGEERAGAQLLRSAVPDPRPSCSAFVGGSRCAARCGPRSAHAAWRRSPRSARLRSAPDTAPRSRFGSAHRRRQLSMPRAARAGQTGPGPSRGLSLPGVPWRVHTEDPHGGLSRASTSPTSSRPPTSYTTFRDVTHLGVVRHGGVALAHAHTARRLRRPPRLAPHVGLCCVPPVPVRRPQGGAQG
jgi:hypothetical protein